MFDISSLCSFLTCLVVMVTTNAIDWSDLQLPEEHLPYFFRNNPDVRKQCANDRNCPHKDYMQVERCWGYEDKCAKGDRMSMPYCTHTEDKRLKLGQRVEKFWREVDFGYVLQNKLSLVTYCTPRHQEDSSLQCVSGLRYCRATNLFLDLRTADFNFTNRYRLDTLKPGEVGGHCVLDKKAINSQMTIRNKFLSSWTPELQNFEKTSFRPIRDGHCDVIINKPTFIMKLDAGINLYHHFCDFLNLYISQHVNNAFSTDINIFFWHPVRYRYFDPFEIAWQVFTRNPILNLNEFGGKRVCFKQAVFSFLPRMPRGLYYVIKPIENCYGSSMIRAFSQHVLHRLGVKQLKPRQGFDNFFERHFRSWNDKKAEEYMDDNFFVHCMRRFDTGHNYKDKLRVTFLSRSTNYRRIINEEKIAETLRADERFDVQLVDFSRRMSLVDQMHISQNTDILISIHGAGLTHLLFLPDWAVVFEIYNCGDPACYLNLARMRGVKYITWEKQELIQSFVVSTVYKGNNPVKFNSDYIIDENETLRLVTMAADHVTAHQSFTSAIDRKPQGSELKKEEL